MIIFIYHISTFPFIGFHSLKEILKPHKLLFIPLQPQHRTKTHVIRDLAIIRINVVILISS